MLKMVPLNPGFSDLYRYYQGVSLRRFTFTVSLDNFHNIWVPKNAGKLSINLKTDFPILNICRPIPTNQSQYLLSF